MAVLYAAAIPRLLADYHVYRVGPLQPLPTDLASYVNDRFGSIDPVVGPTSGLPRAPDAAPFHERLLDTVFTVVTWEPVLTFLLGAGVLTAVLEYRSRS